MVVVVVVVKEMIKFVFYSYTGANKLDIERKEQAYPPFSIIDCSSCGYCYCSCCCCSCGGGGGGGDGRRNDGVCRLRQH